MKSDNPKGVGRRLLLETDKDDSLVYADAERVGRGDLSSFLPFTYQRDGRILRFVYYAGAACQLDRIMAQALSADHFGAIVVSFLSMLRACEDSGLSRLRIMFDVEDVFYDPTCGMLRFAYVPTRMFAGESSETEFLSRVCSMAKVPANIQPLVAATWDFASRTSLLTSTAFSDFLAGWGFEVSGRDRASARSRHGSGTTSPARAGRGWDFVAEAQSGNAGFGSAEASREAGGGGGVVEGVGAAACLVRVSTGTRYELNEGRHLLGRSGECSVALEGAQGVSRRHASLVLGPDACTIVDLGSTNGLVVNGSPVEPNAPVPLSSGDRIKLGVEELLFERC